MQLERSNYYSSAYVSVYKFNYLENEMEATVEYKPVQVYPWSPDDMWAEKGDIIIVRSPVHDGYIRGENPRLNSKGRFPMYLLKEHFKFENSTAFVNINDTI
uniref:Uncharacterized protein n=1 Tax=Meloidogyne enterolobii TaxID=390850 RepID=A0A6V7UF60_MELEN|nr:unnamed protein product [Meloidogyne enterolobii]